jgi:hypothetical protein
LIALQKKTTMKFFTKIIAGSLTMAAMFIGLNVKAQIIPKNGLRLGLGVEGLLPTGNLHNISNIGAGGTMRLQYGVANNLAITLTSGYYNFFGKTVNGYLADGNGNNIPAKIKNLGMVPVKVGIKSFFTNNLYFGAEGGAAFETTGFGAIKGFESGYKKNTKLLLTPGVGYSSKSWDVGVRYENYSGQSNNYGAVGLRIAYGFGL